jgi:hypothetical protein
MKYILTLLIAIIVMIGCQENKGPKEVSRIPYGDGHCVLMDNGWVIIEDKNSKDALPITLVSESLIKAFEEDLEKKQNK